MAVDPLKLLDRIVPLPVAAGLLAVPASVFEGIDPARLTLAAAFRAARKQALADRQTARDALRAPARKARAAIRKAREKAARGAARLEAEQQIATASVQRLADLLAADLLATAARLATVDPGAANHLSRIADRTLASGRVASLHLQLEA